MINCTSCEKHSGVQAPKLCPICLIKERDALRDELESMIFWTDDLLTLAREINRDLMQFYEPIKGWPPHIERLLAPTDHDSVLAEAKILLQNTGVDRVI